MRTTEELIEQAKRTEGGHLSIGRGGFTLHVALGHTLSGYAVEPMKQQCIAAGLPVIDSRSVPFDTVAHLAIHGPMVAVGSEARHFLARMFSTVPLAEHVANYRSIGAEIHNFPEV